MTPVIGITTYEDQASWRNWSARAAILPYVYVDSIRRSGGRAVLLPPGGDDAEASATVAGLDGLVVTGGPDIDPVRYGAARHPRTQVPVTARDTWDLSVTSHALRQGVPLLAICRGMQILNVCRGGTLHQHVPDLKGHQAVNLLGDGLKAVAWEEDGTIEAVEAGPSELDGFSGFLLGVQWHPEQGSDLRVFGALVSAAAERAAARNTVLAPMI